MQSAWNQVTTRDWRSLRRRLTAAIATAPSKAKPSPESFRWTPRKMY